MTLVFYAAVDSSKKYEIVQSIQYICQDPSPNSSHFEILSTMAGSFLTQMRPPAPIFTEKDCPDLSGKVLTPYSSHRQLCQTNYLRCSSSQEGMEGSDSNL